MAKGGYFNKIEKELNCKGCKWRDKRHQKCSCCARNPSLKDNYVKEDNDGK